MATDEPIDEQQEPADTTLESAPTVEEAVQQVATTGVALFGEVARMYEEGYLSRENQIAKPTRVKEKFYLNEYIVPRWGKVRLNQILHGFLEGPRTLPAQLGFRFVRVAAKARHDLL